MNRIFYSLCVGLLIFGISCSGEQKSADALVHIDNAELKSLLEKVFEAHGGLEKWNAMIALKYHKSYSLYLEDSTVEKSADQFHHYQYEPETLIKIASRSGDQSKRLVFDNGKIQEMINGTVNLEASETALMNQLQSSLFVIAQPFKLADQGVELTYEGIQTKDSKEVHIVKAVYDPTKHSSHTTPDTWYLYFDKKNYLLDSYLVQHLDHFSLVKNLETVSVNGFTFPAKRKSYRVDEEGNILYLRADYAYRDFVFN